MADPRLTDKAGERIDGTATQDGLGADWSAVATHIKRLPTPQREVLKFRFRDALSYAEIASLLHVPLGTVHSRMARAKELIRTRTDDGALAADDMRQSGGSVGPSTSGHDSNIQPASKDLV